MVQRMSSGTTSDAVATELRELANAIENASRASPCMSVACRIVSVCADHLRAIAAVHEKTAEIEKLTQIYAAHLRGKSDGVL